MELLKRGTVGDVSRPSHNATLHILNVFGQRVGDLVNFDLDNSGPGLVMTFILMARSMRKDTVALVTEWLPVVNCLQF